MNKIKLITLSMLAVAVLFTSCKDDDPVVDDPIFGPTLEVTPDAVEGWYGDAVTINFTVATANGIQSLDITSNQTDTVSIPELHLTESDGDFDGQENEFVSSYQFTMPSGNPWGAGDVITLTFVAGHIIDNVTYTTTRTVTATYVEPITSNPFTFELTGQQLYNADAPVGFLGAYNLDAGVGVSSDTSNDPEKDMRNLSVAPDWVASWDVPSNGTMWVKADASFDYATASDLTVGDAYTSGTASGMVTDALVGDVYIADLRGTGEYAVVWVTDIVEVASNEDYLEFSFKKQ